MGGVANGRSGQWEVDREGGGGMQLPASRPCRRERCSAKRHPISAPELFQTKGLAAERRTLI